MPHSDSKYTQRTNRKPHGHGYEETQEHFNVDHWYGIQDVNVEDIRYEFYRQATFEETGYLSKGFVQRLDYQGWRLNGKYFASHPKPMFEFKFYLRNEAPAKIKALKEILCEQQLPSFGGISIDVNEKQSYTFISVTFYEEDNSKDMKKLLDFLVKLDPELTKVVQDIKETISNDCFRWFLWALNGRRRNVSDMSQFEYACTKLHHNHFEGVPSPFYLAADYLKSQNEVINAALLLGKIPSDHWQYEQAQKLKQEMENTIKGKDNEIADLKKQLEALRLQLTTKTQAPELKVIAEATDLKRNTENQNPGHQAPLMFSANASQSQVLPKLNDSAEEQDKWEMVDTKASVK